MKTTFKRIISLALAAVMVFGTFGAEIAGIDFAELFSVKAEAATYSGTAGTNITWTLDTDTGVLEINGTGNIENSSSYGIWLAQREYIKTVKIDNGITSIGDFAFFNCQKLTSITIPNSVTSIGNRAFYNCANLTNITLPDNITIIGDNAFESCSGLTSITISNDVTSIGYMAFQYCSSLKSITFEENSQLTTIGTYAFMGCESLANLKIPNGVTNIGKGAFSSCSSLTSITIPNGVTCINPSTFSYCKNLTSIIIPDSITSIGDYAFSGCDVSSITIPDSVKSIGHGAFQDCIKLTSISLPDNSASINSSAFKNTGYYRDSTNWTDGLLYIDKYLIAAKSVSSGSYSIKPGTQTIADSTFESMFGLFSITIPDSVRNIGKRAFFECKNLTSIIIPDGVTSIGEAAFYECGIENIIIPDSVTLIGDCAFQACPNLTNIIIPNSVIEIGSNAFGSSNYYNNANNWTDGVLYIGKHLIEAEESLSGTYTIKPDTLSIANNAFYFCENLTGVIIPDSVTIIGDYTFFSCFDLASISLSDNITSIGDYAFYQCNSLSSVTIPDTVTSIGYEAFYSCYKLKSIHIPASVTYIGDNIVSNHENFEYICSETQNCTAYTYAVENNYPFRLCSGHNGDAVLTNIKIKTLPDKTEYYIGDKLDTKGLTLTATYSNGTTKTISSGFSCIPSEFLVFVSNTETVHVTYGNKTCTFNVTVKNNELEKIEVNTMPDNTQYYVGDTLDTTGLTLTATYTNGTTKTISSGFICSPTVFNTAGTQTVTVTYDDKTCTFDVSVEEDTREYYVTYMVNGKRYAKYTVMAGDPVPAPAVNPIVDGMIFEGWSPEIVQTMPRKDLVYTAVFHTHNYVGSALTQPTCTQHGTTLYRCSCGKSYTDTVPALSHSWGAWSTLVDATATANGREVRYCSRCGAEEYNTIPATSANFRVNAVADQVHTGFALRPAIEVYSLSGQLLSEYEHYEVSYKNNTDCGVATVTVTGVGEYAGVVNVNFNITKKNVSDLSYAEIPDVTYSGEAHTPDPVIYFGNKLLVKGVDYTVSYSANINVGRVTITITGIGNFTGTKVIYFNIIANSSPFSVPVIGNQTYTGGAITPDFNLFSGDTLLRKNVDYTVTYQNNVNVGFGIIIIKGIGNYSGTIVVIFRITATRISLAQIPSLNDASYSGSDYKPDFSKNPIILGNKTLVEGVDFRVEIYNNRNAGTVKIVIIGIGNFTGTIVIYVNIRAVSIRNASVSSISDAEFTGSAITPTFTVTYNGKTLRRYIDYIVEYRNNVFAGTATVIITGIGNYSGQKSITFRIIGGLYFTVNATTDSETLGYDSTMQINVSVDPYLQSGYKLAYSSSNTKIASVDKNGVIKALDEGEVIITVTVTDRNGNTVRNPDGSVISSEIRIRCTMTFWQKIIRFFRNLFSIFSKNTEIAEYIITNK